MNKFNLTIAFVYLVIFIAIANSKSVIPFAPGIFFMLEWQVLVAAFFCIQISSRELSWLFIKTVSRINFFAILILWIIYMIKRFPETNALWFLFISIVLLLIHEVILIFCKYAAIDQPRMKEEEKKRLQK